MTDAQPVTPPQPDVVLLTSANLDQARGLLNRFYYPVAVSVGGRPDEFELDFQVIQLGPLTVGQLSFAASATVVTPAIDGYHVTLPMAGHVLTRQGGNEVNAGPDVAAVFCPGSPTYSRHGAHSSELDVKIEQVALEAELESLLGRPIDGPIDLPPAMSLRSGPGLSWSRLVRLLRDEVDHPDGLIRHPLMADRLRQTILSGLLLSVPHRYHDELTAPAAPGPPRAIRRAVQAIHDEPERPFGVADLAAEAKISVRSLQEGFKRHVGQTPMAYLQQVRLDRVHGELRHADPQRVTVAAVAHRWGFAHLGRFASAYRRRFGESPSETLRDSN